MLARLQGGLDCRCHSDMLVWKARECYGFDLCTSETSQFDCCIKKQSISVGLKKKKRIKRRKKLIRVAKFSK